jgi:hypothetical protein
MKPRGYHENPGPGLWVEI